MNKLIMTINAFKSRYEAIVPVNHKKYMNLIKNT